MIVATTFVRVTDGQGASLIPIVVFAVAGLIMFATVGPARPPRCTKLGIATRTVVNRRTSVLTTIPLTRGLIRGVVRVVVPRPRCTRQARLFMVVISRNSVLMTVVGVGLTFLAAVMLVYLLKCIRRGIALIIVWTRLNATIGIWVPLARRLIPVAEAEKLFLTFLGLFRVRPAVRLIR